VQLRDYQLAAIDSIRESWSRGVGSVLISLATGLGKTVIMASIPLYLKPRPDDIMMVLVNRDELVSQTIEKIRAVHGAGTIGIEKAGSRARASSSFIVASVQTLRTKRLQAFFQKFEDRIGILLIDEAHHAVAPSYRAIVNEFFMRRPDGLVVGVTATPQRSDGLGLKCVFQEAVFHHDLEWAVENGYLVNVRCFKVASSVSLDTVRRHGDDFAVGQLQDAIDVGSRNDLVVSAYLKHTPGKRAIAFCPTVKHAEHLNDTFVAAGVSCAWASTRTSKARRREIVEAFRQGRILVLVNCGLYIEGFDVPDVEVIIGCRPTQSDALYVQMMGRGMRPLDDVAAMLGPGTTAEYRRNAIASSRKPFVTVLDVVDQAKRHSLCTLPTLFGLEPQFDMEGEDVLTSVQRYRDLAAKDPVAARETPTVSNIDTVIERVDAFAVPLLNREAIDMTSMAWRQGADNQFRLSLPTCFEARMPDGSRIKHFARRYRECLSEARQRGAFPFEAFAQREIGFDPASLREVVERLEIRPTTNRGYDVFIERDGHARKLGWVAALHEAFTRAERWITNNRSDLAPGLHSRASWRQAPSAPNQIRTLLEEFNVPLHLIPDTNGECQLLIDKLVEENAARTLGQHPAA
jgi:superfamily II DNA or RNA helicase